MSRKRYEYKHEEEAPIRYDTALPVHLPVANYYRQSTFHQVGNQSTAMQTVDMAEYLRKLGWAEENILMIDMDAGLSGTRKIDERPGMSQVFRLITTGKIGAVSCQDEDRLFRDVTQIQVNIFIEACREHRVLVITPSMVYNFHHEQMGSYHARQFRFKAEMAAEYITAYVKGRLQKAKRRVLMDGRWAGPPMPPGYMADMRKTLPSGAPNPDWRKFAIFEPYAEVVRAYWQLFLHYGGQLRPTARHILEYGPYYPDPGSCQPPEGFKTVYRIRQHHGKWCITRHGLREMLTNAMYAGHWMVNDSIAIWDNHPAIIDQELFLCAFHYLSERGLDGNENKHYAPIRVHERPSTEEERDEPWPLCAGLLEADDVDGKRLRIGARWSKTNNNYSYEHWSKAEDRELWCKRAAKVDAVIVGEMLGRMGATFDFATWESAMTILAEQEQEEQALRVSQMKQLRTVMDNLIVSLGTLTHPQMIRAAEKNYADAEAEYERLQDEMANRQSQTLQVAQIRTLRESCKDIFTNWPQMTRDEQRETIHAFLNRAVAVSYPDHRLDLTLYWLDNKESKVSIPGTAGEFALWTEAETARLVELFRSDADQIEIAREFPERTWNSISQRFYLAVPKEQRQNKRRKRIIRESETYRAYEARTAEDSLADMSSEADSEKARHDEPS
jgi:DNA invertase Pin-like site-specific DNA recombinase